MSRTIFICEDRHHISKKYDLVFLWNSFDEKAHIISLPQVVEKESEQLKKQYLSWLHDFGQADLLGKKIVEHMAIRPDFSAWWLSLLVEKSQWKSKRIYDVFRLLAFGLIINQHKNIDSVSVCLKDQQVKESFRLWAAEKKIQFKCSPISTNQKQKRLENVLEKIPYPIQAAASFVKYILTRWPLRRTKQLPDNDTSSEEKCFIAPFFNFEKRENGQFYSRYWTKLHDLFEEKKSCNIVQWIHLFIKTGEKQSAKQAAETVQSFNQHSQKNQKHSFFENELGIDTVANSLKDYFKLMCACWRVGKPVFLFEISGTGLNVWPLLKHDWYDSIVGRTAAINCLFLNLFEARFAKMTRQEKGWYLLENQNWERILIYCWKKAGHGLLHGIQHTVGKYWDLRHYHDPRTYKLEQLCLPVPDKVMLNGERTVQMYRAAGFPEPKIEKAEALRFLYLENLSSSKDAFPPEKKKRLLLLGDVQASVTRRMMTILAQNCKALDEICDVYVKLHPASSLDLSEFSSLNMTVVEDSLEKLVDSYDIAFTSNGTTSSLDAYLAGKKVISMIEPERFNMSPLRNIPGIRFVSTSGQLLDALNTDAESAVLGISHFFYTQADLPKWKAILTS